MYIFLISLNVILVIMLFLVYRKVAGISHQRTKVDLTYLTQKYGLEEEDVWDILADAEESFPPQSSIIPPDEGLKPEDHLSPLDIRDLLRSAAALTLGEATEDTVREIQFRGETFINIKNKTLFVLSPEEEDLIKNLADDMMLTTADIVSQALGFFADWEKAIQMGQIKEVYDAHGTQSRGFLLVAMNPEEMHYGFGGQLYDESMSTEEVDRMVPQNLVYKKMLH